MNFASTHFSFANVLASTSEEGLPLSSWLEMHQSRKATLARLSHCLSDTSKPSVAAREIDRAASAIGERLHPDFLGMCVSARMLTLPSSHGVIHPTPDLRKTRAGVLKVLWNRGARDSDPAFLSDALTRACNAGSIVDLETLLSFGVSPDSVHLQGNTAISLAVREDSKLPILRILLAAGANPDFTYEWHDGPTLLHPRKKPRGPLRTTPALAEAAFYGAAESLQVLLEHGADPSIQVDGKFLFEHSRCPKKIMTPLRAAYERHLLSQAAPDVQKAPRPRQGL